MLIGADLFCLFLLFVSIKFMVRKLYLRFLLLCSLPKKNNKSMVFKENISKSFTNLFFVMILCC